MKPYLEATDDELIAQFGSLLDLDDVAHLLELPARTLRWILYVAKERRHYSERTIDKKHGGIRRICAPPRNLRILQDKLLRILTLVYTPKRCVTGFVVGRNVVDNATKHLAKRYVLNLDIHDYFPSIHIGRVRGTLQSNAYNVGENAARVLAQIVCHDDGHLPQGAPTSPVIANMVTAPLDSALIALAQQYRLSYSRYADDITLSTNQRFLSSAIASVDETGECHLGPQLLDTLASHGFAVREGKTRLRTPLQRQRVTGLVVNHFPNVARHYIRELRALLHSCRTDGLAVAADRYASHSARVIAGPRESWILNVIQGKLAYLSMVRGAHDHVVRGLRNQARLLHPTRFGDAISPADLNTSTIRWFSRRSPDWPKWATRYGQSIFSLRCSDSRIEGFGTAFRVGLSRFMTAGHNASDAVRAEDGPVRILQLELPMETPVRLRDIRWLASRSGGVDLAIGTAELSGEWSGPPIPTQERLPQIGEEVVALGYPSIGFRHSDLVMHVGRVEAVTRGYREARYVQLSFASGPSLSGAPLLDANGYCLGVMIENTYTRVDGSLPDRAYGQAIAIGHWRALPGAGQRLTIA